MHFSETVKATKELMEKELKDKTSQFYIYKIGKVAKHANIEPNQLKESTVKNSPITADDIAWYLGKVTWLHRVTALPITADDIAWYLGKVWERSY